MALCKRKQWWGEGEEEENPPPAGLLHSSRVRPGWKENGRAQVERNRHRSRAGRLHRTWCSPSFPAQVWVSVPLSSKSSNSSEKHDGAIVMWVTWREAAGQGVRRKEENLFQQQAQHRKLLLPSCSTAGKVLARQDWTGLRRHAGVLPRSGSSYNTGCFWPAYQYFAYFKQQKKLHRQAGLVARSLHLHGERGEEGGVNCNESRATVQHNGTVSTQTFHSFCRPKAR